MSLSQPAGDCVEVIFGASYVISDLAEVALEDYARALARARAVEAIRSGEGDGRVTGLHLCGLPAPPAPTATADIEAFARDLQDHRGNGLGWG